MGIKKIGIVSTARAFTLAQLQPTISDLQSWGFEVVVGESIGVVNNQFAGSDKLRATDLQQMLTNPKIDAVLCAKGGYGTARILDLIEWETAIEKPILGFSDITALHCHVYNLGWKTVHSAMCSTWEFSTEESRQSLKSYLCNEPLHYHFAANKLNRVGNVEAEIIGGNLSVLYSIMGSESEVDFTGKILFLEDLDEYLYHIDRMMLNLKRAGKLQNLAGLLVGGFSDMHDNAIPFGKTAYEIINSHITSYNYPVAFGLPCGHEAENLTLPFGVTAKLIITEQENCLSFG